MDLEVVNSKTNTATLETLNEICSAIDKGEIAAVIFLDLTKAFDNVNHY